VSVVLRPFIDSATSNDERTLCFPWLVSVPWLSGNTSNVPRPTILSRFWSVMRQYSSLTARIVHCGASARTRRYAVGAAANIER